MRCLLKLFPIKTDRCIVEVITKGDVDWYTEIVKQPFFNKNVDKENTSLSDNKIKGFLLNLIYTYKFNPISKYDIRAVIKKNDVNIGGITIFPREKGIYEIGYWILPEYQGIGIATEVLRTVTSKMVKSIKDIKEINLIMHEDNVASIKVAKKAGYVYKETIKGRKKRNLVYIYRGVR